MTMSYVVVVNPQILREALYQRYCSTCYGDVAVSWGVLLDLRYSAMLVSAQQWSEVVLGGTLQPFGMDLISKELSQKDVEAVRAYVILRANQSLAEAKAGKK